FQSSTRSPSAAKRRATPPARWRLARRLLCCSKTRRATERPAHSGVHELRAEVQVTACYELFRLEYVAFPWWNVSHSGLVLVTNSLPRMLTRCGPRIDERLVAALARLDDPTLPIAETNRRLGVVAEGLGLIRPSYQQVRIIDHLRLLSIDVLRSLRRLREPAW